MANNVWADLKKKQSKSGASTAWYALQNRKPTRPVENTPVMVDNQFPAGTISFDLETGSVTEMWRSVDPAFIRLCGHSMDDGGCYNDPMPLKLIDDILDHEGWIIGHNIMNFDCILLDKFCGVSILDLAKKDRLIDTKMLAFLADPPFSRTKEGEIEKMYSLQTVGTKYLGTGKMVDVATGNSVLKELAKEFGGFDKIPVDHPKYNEYLVIDVEVTRDLARVLPMSDYTRREHKIAAIASTISLQGFRIDRNLLEERIEEGETKRLKILTSLAEYGLPGPETSKSPHRTNKGLAAIETAFSDLGVTLERTATGRPAMGKEVLQGVADASEDPAVIDLAEAILSLNGIRTIYANIYDNIVANERVHPKINLRQSTGRWSIQDPGLTVVGKRGGKVKEREVFLPDEGCVLISCDLAQVDARAVAALSQDMAYLELFTEGHDLHAEMAERLFGDAKKRELAKAAVHGINYGMRAGKLAWTTGMPLHEAEKVIAEFEKNFPVLTQWQWKVREIGEVSGVLYNGFGRMMRIEPERSFTQSPALMGQSTARDILCEGALRLWEMGGEDVVRMIRGVIHDEIVLSVPVADIEEIEHLVVKAMSFEWRPIGAEHAVAITGGLQKNSQGLYNRGSNWMDCYAK